MRSLLYVGIRISFKIWSALKILFLPARVFYRLVAYVVAYVYGYNSSLSAAAICNTSCSFKMLELGEYIRKKRLLQKVNTKIKLINFVNYQLHFFFFFLDFCFEILAVYLHLNLSRFFGYVYLWSRHLLG